MKRLIYLVITIFLIVPTAVLSEDNIDNYVTVKLGIYTPTDDLDDVSFDSGFNGEISYGRFFHKHAAVEVGLGYFQSKANVSGTLPILGTFTEDDQFKGIPLTATLKGVYPIGIGDIYGGGGAGVYFTDFDLTLNSSSLGVISFSDTDMVLGFHLLAGINFDITEKIFLGIEGKHIWTEEAKVEGVIMGVPVQIKGNVNGFMITGNIGFRF